MHPEYACNLLPALSLPPWEESLCREVYMTLGGEQRTPFHAYVRPRPICHCSGATKPSVDAWPFTRLAPELQLSVLANCSADTLYQWMHVSSWFRREASNLFWSQPDTYFLVDAYWLLQGAYAGGTFADTTILTYVQQVEVACPTGISDRIFPLKDGRLHVQEGVAVTFWAMLRSRCPRVKKVILNHNGESGRWEDDKEPFAYVLQLLLWSCPPDIKASALYKTKQKSRQPVYATKTPSRLWRRVSFALAADGEWEEREPELSRKTILLPPKLFQGPVGRFQQLLHERCQQLTLRRVGLWPLMVEALDRYHFDQGRNEPFSCPLPACDGYFTKAGAWSVHAAENHCGQWSSLLSILPGQVGVHFEARRRALESNEKRVQEQYEEVQHTWRTASKTTQQEIQRSWMEQLGSDPSWETSKQGEQSDVWRHFINHMTPGWLEG